MSRLPIYLSIHEVNQMASGGSYVVIYDATVHLSEEPVVVVALSDSNPQEGSEEDVEAALSGIKAGAEEALTERGMGARIDVTRLWIHPADLKVWRFAYYTRRELGAALERWD